uniref:Uncharacterized protein n=1 Tax=Phaseolus vulgaris TaxID=3885 RepID=V7BF11_PHAVU|nr:hypothetical protein PHAVU_007G157600g [Phaseolus vulgaris]ESW16449.1 hypothetical protein PHAVU_007G157600g [Phaseolus vulgaris]
MFLWLSNFIRSWPLLMSALSWVALMTFTVAVASLSTEVAFVSTIASSRTCKTNDGSLVRVPLEETPCFPARLLTKTSIDVIVPPIFAALIVAASACVVRAVGLWEHHQTTHSSIPT